MNEIFLYQLGRYPPQANTDLWLTILSMVTGAICYAVTIGHIAVLVNSTESSRRLYNEKVIIIIHPYLFSFCNLILSSN